MNEVAVGIGISPPLAREAPETCPLVRKRTLKSFLAAALALIAAMLASPAGAQSLPQGVLKNFSLSPYQSPMIPPEFDGRTPEGRVLSLESLRGKVVLLSFWAVWCLECRAEMPALEQVYRDFGARGLVVLGMNYRDEGAEVKRYARDLDLTFPLVLDPRGEVRAAYGVVGFPTTFIIGRNGKATALAIGPRRWDSSAGRAVIEMLLAQPAMPRVRE